MRTIISGRIFYIDEEERIIGLRVKDRQSFFYLQRALFNKISKYLEISRFIQFVIEDEPRMYTLLITSLKSWPLDIEKI